MKTVIHKFNRPVYNFMATAGIVAIAFVVIYSVLCTLIVLFVPHEHFTAVRMAIRPYLPYMTYGMMALYGIAGFFVFVYALCNITVLKKDIIKFFNKY